MADDVVQSVARNELFSLSFGTFYAVLSLGFVRENVAATAIARIGGLAFIRPPVVWESAFGFPETDGVAFGILQPSERAFGNVDGWNERLAASDSAFLNGAAKCPLVP